MFASLFYDYFPETSYLLFQLNVYIWNNFIGGAIRYFFFFKEKGNYRNEDYKPL